MQQTIAAHIHVAVPSFTITPVSVDYGTVGPDSFPAVTVNVANPSSVDVNGIQVALSGTTPPGVVLQTTVLPNVQAHSNFDTTVQLHVPANAVDGDYNFGIVFTH